MTDEHAHAIKRTAFMLANMITMMPEPNTKNPYTWGTCNLGPAFCEIDPDQADIEAVRMMANLRIGDAKTSCGPIRSRRIVRIYPYQNDLLALFVNLN